MNAKYLRVSRLEDRWGQPYYECDTCGVQAEAIAAIDHQTACSLGGEYLEWETTLEDEMAVTSPFPESTEKMLTDIILEAQRIYQTNDAVDFPSEVEPYLSEIDGVRWTASGSTSRFALGLGRVSPHGEFHLESGRGVVLKIDLGVRVDESQTPVSGNIDELLTWEKARKTETDSLFADIVASSADGCWLCMEECIPIELKKTKEMHSRDIVFDRRGEQYISDFLQKAADAGWVNADHKHGNIGLNSDGNPVFLDYGTGPDYEMC